MFDFTFSGKALSGWMNNTKHFESLIQLFFKKLFDERYGKAQQMNSVLAMA